MAGCSKKQYAIMMSAGSEGKKLASKMGGMSQEDFDKEFSALLNSGNTNESYNRDEDEDYQEFDTDSEGDYDLESSDGDGNEETNEKKDPRDSLKTGDTAYYNGKKVTIFTHGESDTEAGGIQIQAKDENGTVYELSSRQLDKIEDETGDNESASKNNYDIETDKGWENFKDLVHEVAVDNDQNDISKLSGDTIGKIIEKGNLPYTEEQVAGFIGEMVEEYKQRGYDEDDDDDEDEGYGYLNPDTGEMVNKEHYDKYVKSDESDEFKIEEHEDGRTHTTKDGHIIKENMDGSFTFYAKENGTMKEKGNFKTLDEAKEALNKYKDLINITGHKNLRGVTMNDFDSPDDYFDWFKSLSDEEQKEHLFGKK